MPAPPAAAHAKKDRAMTERHDACNCCCLGAAFQAAACIGTGLVSIVFQASQARWNGRPAAGVGFGEASHPGPATTQGLEVLGGLGPGLIESLKGMITQLVQQAIQQSLSQAGLATPPGPSPRNLRKKKAKLKKAAFRKVLAGGSGAQVPTTPAGGAPTTDPSPAKGKGKGKGKGDTKPPKAKGKGKDPTTGPANDDPDEWTVVKHRRENQEEVELRQQDWDPPIVRYCQLANKFEESTESVFRAVVHCMPGQITTAKNLLRASGKQHSVLLIEFTKDSKPDDRKGDDKGNLRQRVPVKAGNFVRFLDSFVHQVTSPGLDAAKPKGLTTSAKITAKESAILYIKIPQEFVSGDVFRKFGSSPRAQIAQWAAAQRVQLIDTFKWTEELLPGDRRQVFGIVKVSAADAPTLLAQSGSGGVFVQAPRDKASSQYVQWIERNKDEPSLAVSTLPGLCAHQVHLASRVEASSLGVGIMPTPKPWFKGFGFSRVCLGKSIWIKQGPFLNPCSSS